MISGTSIITFGLLGLLNNLTALGATSKVKWEYFLWPSKLLYLRSYITHGSCIGVCVTVRFSLHVAYILLYVKYDFIEPVPGLSLCFHSIKATYPSILGMHLCASEGECVLYFLLHPSCCFIFTFYANETYFLFLFEKDSYLYPSLMTFLQHIFVRKHSFTCTQ